jgi:hypothetical protein
MSQLSNPSQSFRPLGSCSFQLTSSNSQFDLMLFLIWELHTQFDSSSSPPQAPERHGQLSEAVASTQNGTQISSSYYETENQSASDLIADVAPGEKPSFHRLF